MPNFKTHQHLNIPVDQIRKLNPGESSASVHNATQTNKLDEVFFEYEGETYLGVGEQIDIAALRGKASARLQLQPGTEAVEVKLLGLNDEINSWSEGWAKGASLGDSLSKAWDGFMASSDWGAIHSRSQVVGQWPTQAVPSEPVVSKPPSAVDIPPTDPKPTNPVSQPPVAGTPDGNTPDIEVYFTQVHEGHLDADSVPANNPDKKLAEFIRSANKSLDIAAFEIDSATVVDAILEVHQDPSRDVQVRVVTDSNYLHEEELHRLIDAGIPVVDDDRSGLMHNKFVVLDAGTKDAAVWTGSMNMTDNGAWRNNNNALRIRSQQLAENFTQEFEEMFVDRRFGVTSPKAVAHPSVTVGKTRIETYFASENAVAGKVAEALNKAEESIHFMAFSFTHDAIGEVVAKKFQDPDNPVEVKGVFEKLGSGTKYSEYGSLKALGADVKKDGNKKVMHHKVFIIDGKTVITGSFNFSASADKKNDENLLIIEDESIAQLYEAEFQKVHAQGVAE